MLMSRMNRPFLRAAALAAALTGAAAHAWQPVSPSPLPPAVQWQFVWPAPSPAPAPVPIPAPLPPGAHWQGALSIGQIHDRLYAAGYRDIKEIKLDKRGIYKVKARDVQGQRVKLRVSAATGEVLRVRPRD